jgi:hypothetical protein
MRRGQILSVDGFESMSRLWQAFRLLILYKIIHKRLPRYHEVYSGERVGIFYYICNLVTLCSFLLKRRRENPKQDRKLDLTILLCECDI